MFFASADAVAQKARVCRLLPRGSLHKACGALPTFGARMLLRSQQISPELSQSVGTPP